MQGSPTRGYGLLESYLAKRRADFAEASMPKECREGSILDLACGSPPAFLLRTKFFQKYGIDLRFIEKSLLPGNITCYQQDLSKRSVLPLQDSSIHVVTLLAGAEHLQEDALLSVFEEMNRVLTVGGFFIITTPTPRAEPILSIFSKVGLVSREEIMDHKQLYSAEYLGSLLVRCGFPASHTSYKTFECGMNLRLVSRKP